MRQKIDNYLSVTVDGVDLTTVSGLVFWVKQATFFREYTPEVADSGTMLVHIPKEDAMHLFSGGRVEMQLAFTGSDGRPLASDVVQMPVERLLKEGGYDSV